ncbi:MAG: hypothetical protein Tsb002_02020 [Wenzhouxiangellaceae bacterium]
MNIHGSLLLAGSIVLATVSVDAMAQACNEERVVQARALTEASYKRLNSIYEDIGNEKYTEAYSDLNKMLERAGDDYERAVIRQAMGHVAATTEKMQEALDHFNTALNYDVLPNNTQFQMLYQVAQLQMMAENYREGLKVLAEWFCVTPDEEHTSAAYVLKANAHAQLKEYREGLAAIEEAIARGDKPQESWYQLKLAMHFELEQYPQAADTLQILVAGWPDKKQYWTQLSSVYLKIKQDKNALSVLALANRRGILESESEHMQLANLYQYLDVPYKAAEALEQFIEDGKIKANRKHWEQAANAWYQAHELDKALNAYNQAGQFSEDGKLHLRRAYILVEYERWEEARTALRAAIDKGGLSDKDDGNSYLLLGMAEMRLKSYDAAEQAFTQARRFDNTRNAAREWLRQLQDERTRAG